MNKLQLMATRKMSREKVSQKVWALDRTGMTREAMRAAVAGRPSRSKLFPSCIAEAWHAGASTDSELCFNYSQRPLPCEFTYDLLTETTLLRVFRFN